MTVKTKALLYQLLSFALLFIFFKLIIAHYALLDGIWISLTAFVVSTILAPQFKAVKTPKGDQLLMTWIFLKGVKILK